ncbi:MAG: helix-turn-helix transcriptional regulator [Vicinamibacteria bacterium]
MSTINYIRAYRTRFGLTQEEVQKLIEIESSSISRHECARRFPPLPRLLEYEAVFGRPLKELFPWLYEEARKKVRVRAKILARALRRRRHQTPLLERKIAVLEAIATESQAALAKPLALGGTRILAIDPTRGAFGFVEMEGEQTLIRWGASAKAKDDPIERIKWLVDLYQPVVIVTEETSGGNRSRVKATQSFLRSLGRLAQVREKRFVAISRKDALLRVFGEKKPKNKQEQAKILASWFPELADRIPKPRRQWESEQLSSSIFDALVLGLAFYRRERGSRNPNEAKAA